MSLTAVALLNGLLGAICGLRFRVRILIPLITVAIVEVAALMHTRTWAPAFWSAIVLISSLEIGYLIGSTLAALWHSSHRRRVIHDLITYDHGKISGRQASLE
jgi:hypothetical protein